ncbi:MAG: GtrA family protein [Lachnospiraceae bacterium]|nr:GtrA family protein [Lachnospiraceae bacterium]
MPKVAGKYWSLIEVIAHGVLGFCFKLIHKELTDEAFASFMQFVKFGLIGVTNTVLSYVINVAALLSFQKIGMSPKYDYLVAQFVAFVLSVAWSFYWNNKLVFKEDETGQRVWWKALIKTYISYSFTGIFLNSLLSWIWVSLFHISKLVAPLINLVISVPINFLINKFWAFKGE